MRLALIADVHANLPALEAVLEALSGLRFDRLLCLGDLVGYNAQPSECVARVRAAAHDTVAGNHDVDVTLARPAAGTNAAARVAQEWTRARLAPDDLAWLAALPRIVTLPGRAVAVHGCYLNDTHVSGYVTGTMLEANLLAVESKPAWPRVAFCGHTHVPMCGWLEAGGAVEARLDGQTVRWPENARAVLVNPGAVGQPRDGDPRAAFALIDLEARALELRRAAYDVERAARAVVDAGLPVELAERLREGR